MTGYCKVSGHGRGGSGSVIPGFTILPLFHFFLIKMIKSSGLMAETLIVNVNWRKDDAKLFLWALSTPLNLVNPHIITQPQEVQVITHA
jgi:hypothetical protein